MKNVTHSLAPVAEIASTIPPCQGECEHVSCEMQREDAAQVEPAKPKPRERDTVRRELDRVQRQLEGLSKAVKKIKEAT